MATDSELDEILFDLAEAFPDWKPPSPQSTFNQYKASLKMYPAETLRHAARRCIDSCMFFPKIAEIKKAINELPKAGTYKDPEKLHFVPPPPEFYEAMNGLFKKWGIPRKPRYHSVTKLPDVTPRMPYADD